MCVRSPSLVSLCRLWLLYYPAVGGTESKDEISTWMMFHAVYMRVWHGPPPAAEWRGGMGMLRYRHTYEAKRVTSDAGIATSEFKLPLRVAALCVPLCSAMLVLPLEVAEVGEGTLRAEPMTGEVVGIESSPRLVRRQSTWPGKILERKKS